MKTSFRFLAAVACMAALCAVALTACSARQPARSMSDVEDRVHFKADVAAPLATAPAAPGEAAKNEGDSSGRGAASVSDMPALPQERMVVKTATLEVRVRDVGAAYLRAAQLAETGGGYVQTSTEAEEGGSRASVVIRVPPRGFLPLITSLEALGVPTSKTVAGEDVTQEYYDLEGELQNQLEVRGRLLALLKQAAKVTDAIAVEEQLERIGANVNRIKGRMKYLSEMTGMSTVSVTLYSESRPTREGFLNWSEIGHGFFRAGQILVGALFVILQFLVVAIPLAAVVGAATWGVILLVRWWRARRAGASGSARPPAKSAGRKASSK